MTLNLTTINVRGIKAYPVRNNLTKKLWHNEIDITISSETKVKEGISEKCRNSLISNVKISEKCIGGIIVVNARTNCYENIDKGEFYLQLDSLYAKVRQMSTVTILSFERKKTLPVKVENINENMNDSYLINPEDIKELKKQEIKRFMNYDITLPFLESETRAAIYSCVKNKMKNVDELNDYDLKCLSNKSIKYFILICNMCLKQIKHPSVWKTVKCLLLYKKKRNKACLSSYRTLSICSHGYKIYVKMILNRIQKKILDEILKHNLDSDQITAVVME
uniref:DNA-directed RNA polymerase III subunit RPC5 n=1 Tax=Strongyloides venezuelensis TaxID=75913 RepID=A0A0K0EXZ9_STRVS